MKWTNERDETKPRSPIVANRDAFARIMENNKTQATDWHFRIGLSSYLLWEANSLLGQCGSSNEIVSKNLGNSLVIAWTRNYCLRGISSSLIVLSSERAHIVDHIFQRTKTEIRRTRMVRILYQELYFINTFHTGPIFDYFPFRSIAITINILLLYYV